MENRNAKRKKIGMVWFKISVCLNSVLGVCVRACENNPLSIVLLLSDNFTCMRKSFVLFPVSLIFMRISMRIVFAYKATKKHFFFIAGQFRDYLLEHSLFLET